jgi:hypothetical protein
VRRIMRDAIGAGALLLASCASAWAQLPPCYAGFEISPECIVERGLAEKMAAYQRKISEALPRLGASYRISIRLVNNPVEAGYDAARVGDVFTDVVRNDEMRNESFIVNVTADFLEKQPEILFEASSLHEVCHVMNDDLSGYHRNGANIEAAEEHCVLQVTGEARYKEYLQAYAAYQHWDNATFESVLEKVKDVVLVPPPGERDDADRAAAEYFKTHEDGKQHLLVFNGELHDVTLESTRDTVRHDPQKLEGVIKAGKPMIFFHNHPAEDGRAAMFPTPDDFGTAGLLSFAVFREDPRLTVEFRVLQPGTETTIVSYGFKGRALDEIRRLAPIETKQNLADYHLAQDSFNEYLSHVCPVDPARPDPRGCRTHPQYFTWPSDRFFIHNRPQ